MSKQLRVAVLDGPGDIIGTFRHWHAGYDDHTVTHVAFSSQLFDACAGLNANLLMLGEHPRLERVEQDDFVIEHRGNASIGKGGLAYHQAELAHAARILPELARYRPDVVIANLRPYPFFTRLLGAAGAKIIYNLHCVIWPKFGAASRIQQVFHRLSAPALRSSAAVLCVSEDIKRQVRSITGSSAAPFVDFLPLFRRETFAHIPAPDPRARPFRVMFAGRIEHDKGVFDLLSIAKSFRDAGRHDIVFEICGNGSALAELTEKVNALGLQDRVLLRGWCNRAQITESFGRSHVVVVPTKTAFIEGFNMVVVEALLAQRPVISSAVCPALEYVPRAVEVVPPNDVDAYARAILKLADDEVAYRRMQVEVSAAAARFLDAETSYGSAIRYTLESIAAGRPVAPREIPTVIETGPESHAARGRGTDPQESAGY